MKYADGPTVEVEALINAPPSVVWAFVKDVTTASRFSDELQGACWIDEVHFIGRSRHPAVGEWQTNCTVVAREDESVFAWAVGEPENPSSRWSFTLEPVEGGTRLREWMRVGPAPSGLSRIIAARPDKEERIIARRLEEHRTNMQATVDGIKGLAEAELHDSTGASVPLVTFR